MENRERYRITGAEKEMAYRKQQAELKERSRSRTASVLAEWDDEEKADQGKELFYADR